MLDRYLFEDGWSQPRWNDSWTDPDFWSNPYTEKAKIPHRCPVCEGRGFVPNGFYSSIKSWITTTTGHETCRSCGGNGYITI